MFKELKNIPNLIINGLCFCLLFISLNSCNQIKPKEVLNENTLKDSSLTFITVKKGVLETKNSFPAEIQSFQKVDLYAKENSYVKKVWVDIGSKVKIGDLLVDLEEPELNSDLSNMEARVKSQEALWISSKYTYNRLLETSKTPGTIAPNELQEALAKMNSDSAQISSLKAAYRGILDRKSYLKIRAPFGGIISSRNINPGAYVGPSGKGSDLPLFTLEEQKKLRLIISVPEESVSNFKQGGKINFTVNALPGLVFNGVLSRMSGSVSNSLKSERLEADIDNSDSKLLPGMTATVNLEVYSSPESLLIPKSSLMETGRGTFVIKMDSNNKAIYLPVKRGKENSNEIEILGNIKAGDSIIKIANDEIREGTLIKN